MAGGLRKAGEAMLEGAGLQAVVWQNMNWPGLRTSRHGRVGGQAGSRGRDQGGGHVLESPSLQHFLMADRVPTGDLRRLHGYRRAVPSA